jgi:hypothetical protein
MLHSCHSESSDACCQEWAGVCCCINASNSFAAVWGGKLLYTWTCAWMKSKEFPTSMQGKHVKIYSLISDPAIVTEI